MINYFLIFVGFFIIEFFGVLYLKAIEEYKYITSTLYMGLLYAVYFFGIHEFMDDATLLFPITAGAMLGSLGALIYKKTTND